MTTFGTYQSLMTTFGTYQSLMTTFGTYQSLTTAFDTKQNFVNDPYRPKTDIQRINVYLSDTSDILVHEELVFILEHLFDSIPQKWKQFRLEPWISTKPHVVAWTRMWQRDYIWPVLLPRLNYIGN